MNLLRSCTRAAPRDRSRVVACVGLVLAAQLAGTAAAWSQSTAVDSLVLRDGEVVVFGDGRERRLSRTGGRVDDAVVSPDGRWIAYQYVLYWIPEAGLFEDEAERGLEAVHGVAIVDRESGEVVVDLEPPAAEEEGLLLDGWLDAGRLSVLRVAPFEVTGSFIFDLPRRVLTEREYGSAPRSVERPRPRSEGRPAAARAGRRPPPKPGAILVPGMRESIAGESAAPEPPRDVEVRARLRRPDGGGAALAPPPLLVVVWDSLTVAATRRDRGVPLSPVLGYPVQPPDAVPADREAERPCRERPGDWGCRLADRATPEAVRRRMVADSLARLGWVVGGRAWILAPDGVHPARVAAARYGRGACGEPAGVAAALDPDRPGALPPGRYYATADRAEMLLWRARLAAGIREPAPPPWADSVLGVHRARVEARIREWYEPDPEPFPHAYIHQAVVPVRTREGLRWAIGAFYDGRISVRAGGIYDAAGRPVSDAVPGWIRTLDRNGDGQDDVFIGRDGMVVEAAGGRWHARAPQDGPC